MNIIESSTVTAPGFYRMDADEYHRDPCPEPSLSSSIARLMLERSPLHAWTAHPRLNPHWIAGEPNARFDFGSLCHTLLLGQGKKIWIVDAPDWRTKAAQEERKEAHASGALPALKKQCEEAEGIINALSPQLWCIDDCRHAFMPGFGDAEVVMAWREGEHWCRAMVDWLDLRSEHRAIIWDYKTTTASAAPQAVARTIYSLGYHIQGAFYCRGLRALMPDLRDVVFRLVIQEIEPPYALVVVETDAAGRVIGEKAVQAAVDEWARCLRHGWPCYPTRIITAEMPGWKEAEFLEHEERQADQQRTPAHAGLNVLMAG